LHCVWCSAGETHSELRALRSGVSGISLVPGVFRGFSITGCNIIFGSLLRRRITVNNNYQLKRYVVIVLSIVIFFVSIYLAFITYRNYGVVARGISGLVLIYLLFFFIKNSGLDLTTNGLLAVPNKPKYLFFEFTVPIISYWAVMQILEMILSFGK
jgi:hypothetical protein